MRIRPRVLIVDEDSASRTSLGEYLEGKRVAASLIAMLRRETAGIVIG